MAKKMTEEQIPFYYVSPKEYSEQTGMWIEDVKRLIREGRLEGEHNKETGYYKVKVYRDEAVSRKEHEALLQELVKYKTIVNTFLSATEVAGITKERRVG